MAWWYRDERGWQGPLDVAGVRGLLDEGTLCPADRLRLGFDGPQCSVAELLAAQDRVPVPAAAAVDPFAPVLEPQAGSIDPFAGTASAGGTPASRPAVPAASAAALDAAEASDDPFAPSRFDDDLATAQRDDQADPAVWPRWWRGWLLTDLILSGLRTCWFLVFVALAFTVRQPHTGIGIPTGLELITSGLAGIAGLIAAARLLNRQADGLLWAYAAVAGVIGGAFWWLVTVLVLPGGGAADVTAKVLVFVLFVALRLLLLWPYLVLLGRLRGWFDQRRV